MPLNGNNTLMPVPSAPTNQPTSHPPISHQIYVTMCIEGVKGVNQILHINDTLFVEGLFVCEFDIVFLIFSLYKYK